MLKEKELSYLVRKFTRTSAGMDLRQNWQSAVVQIRWCLQREKQSLVWSNVRGSVSCQRKFFRNHLAPKLRGRELSEETHRLCSKQT